MKHTQLTYVRRLKSGDKVVLTPGTEREVLAVRKASGRKPAKGENYFLTLPGERVMMNGEAIVRKSAVQTKNKEA